MLYRILEIPAVYRLVQFLLTSGAKRLLASEFERLFGGVEGMVLDVGCGPALNTPAPDGTIVGVDINRMYIVEFIARSVNPGNSAPGSGSTTPMGCVASADKLPIRDGGFDQSRSFGLLHHLPKTVAEETIKEMIRCVRPGGAIVIIDNAWPVVPAFRPIAWLLLRLDRGRFVRKESELLELVPAELRGAMECRRFNYTYTGLECVSIAIRKAVG